MSAEDDKDVAGETPADRSKIGQQASKKPTAAKKRSAAKKPAAAKTPAGEAKVEAESKPAAEAKPAAKKRAAKKATTEKPPAATDAPAAERKPEPSTETPAESTAKPAAKKQPGPAASGSGAKRAPRRRVVRAHARYVRTSARKARMVCPHLRGKTVGEARAILAFTSREVARDWSKLLESAVANAENNHELLEDDLIVREAYADEGPTIKRFRPRAMGRATPIHKRTSHLTITLTAGS
jgi:ribosomal protein L22